MSAASAAAPALYKKNSNVYFIYFIRVELSRYLSEFQNGLYSQIVPFIYSEIDHVSVISKCAISNSVYSGGELLQNLEMTLT